MKLEKKNDEEDSDNEVVQKEVKEEKPPPKPKRVLSEKQKEALAKGRKKRHELMRSVKPEPISEPSIKDKKKCIKKSAPKQMPLIYSSESESDSESEEEVIPKKTVKRRSPRNTKVIEKHYYYNQQQNDNKMEKQKATVETVKAKQQTNQVVENKKESLIFR